MDLCKLPHEVRSILRSGISITNAAVCITELVTNSLDAGATSIAIRVDFRAYKLQVVDNGDGISKQSLELIGERYMTSKCKSLQDLQGNLDKFGFRGEALASLREISGSLIITSRQRKSQNTYTKIFSYGKDCQAVQASHSRPHHGTTVTVLDFLYNMPVRKNRINVSLDLEEMRSQLECLALVHPQVSFSLRNDANGTLLIHTRKCKDTLESFKQIFGHKLGSCLSHLNFAREKFSLSGYIGKEPHHQKTLQFFYINKRLVVKTKFHKLINMILRKSFILKAPGPWLNLPVPKDMNEKLGMSMTKKNVHAVFVLNLCCAYTEYDITMEPKKNLVEFGDWSGALQCVEEGIRKFLEVENLAVIISSSDTDQSDQKSSITEDDDVQCPLLEELMCLDREEALGRNAGENKECVYETPELQIARAVYGLPAMRKEKAQPEENLFCLDPSVSEKPSTISSVSTNLQDLVQPSVSSDSSLCSDLNASIMTSPLTTSFEEFVPKSYVTDISSDPCRTTSIIHSDSSSSSKESIMQSSQSFLPISHNCKTFTCTSSFMTDECDLENLLCDLDKNETPVSLNYKTPVNCQPPNKIPPPLKALKRPHTNDYPISRKPNFFSKLQKFSLSNNAKKKNIEHTRHFNPSTNAVNLSSTSNVQNTSNCLSTITTDFNQSNVESWQNLNSKPNEQLAPPTFLFQSKIGSIDNFQNNLDRVNASQINKESQGLLKKNEYFAQQDIALPAETPRKFLTNQDFVCTLDSIYLGGKAEVHSKNQHFKAQENIPTENLLFDKHVNRYELFENRFLKPLKEISKEISQARKLLINETPDLQNKLSSCNTDTVLDFDINEAHTKTRERNALSLEGCTNELGPSTLSNSCLLTTPCKTPKLVPYSCSTSGSLEQNNLQDNAQSDTELYEEFMAPRVQTRFVSNTSTSDFNEVHVSENLDLLAVNREDPTSVPVLDEGADTISTDLVFVSKVQPELNKQNTNPASHVKSLDSCCDYVLENLSGVTPNALISQVNDSKTSCESIYSDQSLELDNQNSKNLKTSKCRGQYYEASIKLETKTCNIIATSTLPDACLPSSTEISNVSGNSQKQREELDCFVQNSHSNCEDVPPIPHVPQTSFCMSQRKSFMPIGSSPLFKIFSGGSLEEKNVPLCAQQREELHQAMNESNWLDEQLSTVKWTNLIQPKTSKVAGFEQLVNELLCEGQKNVVSREINIRDACSQNESLVKVYNFIYKYKFEKEILSSIKVIGHWDKKFILSIVKMEEQSDLLVLFDQHAVHERVRLERLTKEYQTDQNTCWFRAVPIQPSMCLELSAREVRIMHSFHEHFNRIGIYFEAVSETSVQILQVPACFKARSDRQHGTRGKNMEMLVTSLVQEQVLSVLETRGVGSRIPPTLQSVLNSEACTGAIKFGDDLSKNDCHLLLNCLPRCKIPFQCAHGRPVLAPIADLGHLTSSLSKVKKPALEGLLDRLRDQL